MIKAKKETIAVQPKRRGRPPKAKPVGRPRKESTNVSPWITEINSLHIEIRELNDKIKAYERSEIGYRAVIDFLEYQLNKRIK